MPSKLSLPLWTKVLIEIQRGQERDCYCEKLNRRVKASRSHIRAMVKLLEQNNLITITPGNKIKRLVLTEQGQEAARSIHQLRSELNSH